MNFARKSYDIFEEATRAYHVTDHVDAALSNPYTPGSIEHDLYLKNWIDAVQWHLEDIIRNPSIEPVEALKIKRRIDGSNQDRTDLVERLDAYFLQQFQSVLIQDQAVINTESPAWALDRLSILVLKIWHMDAEANRKDANPEHIEKCQSKLAVLLEQRSDLMLAIDQLLTDMEQGLKYMKVYKQMKMYNDPALNPVLYQKAK